MSSDPTPPLTMQMRLRVGLRIRELREAHQLSQEKLAERAGVSRYSVYRTELATHSVGLDHLTLIADALGVPVSHLVRN